MSYPKTDDLITMSFYSVILTLVGPRNHVLM